jgi:Domain of unknown function (DUF4383)
MNPRLAALMLCIALLFAAGTDYVPAFLDADGRVFGLFRLDIYKDALHVASGLWALVAAVVSRRASLLFLKIFGTLYFLDGVMGTITGSGFLDLSIVTQGVLDNPPLTKFLSSLPHLFLGAFGIFAGWFGERAAIGASA